MKVTGLRLHGFKSFADAINIPVEPGVTGIVGPNGCGKSNLVEALRFVMGESSYKAMRGGGMEDVIFSGSGNRPARNMAEVTLAAERDDGNSQGPEAIEITRRIERDTGSTYSINGHTVRARDVQILFADAATGAHSSALVRQGQVAELIAAKPVARRSILEDAAGIAGLHARRHEAEQKLRAAEQNLSRLDDVTAEIEARLEELRRQARQAVRYRKISEEIRKYEATLYAINWDSALARLAEAEAELANANAAFEAATAEQQNAAKAEAAAAGRLPELRTAASTATGSLEKLRSALRDIDRDEQQRKERRDGLIARGTDAGADLAREIEIGSDASGALEKLAREEELLRLRMREAAHAIGAARNAAETAAAAVDAREAEFAAAAGALAAAGAERAARERAIREAQAKLARLEEERATVLREQDRIADEAGETGVAEAAAAVAEAEAHAAKREEQAEAAEATLITARETERRARGPYDAAERAFGALEAEARTLARVLDLEKTNAFPPLSHELAIAAGYEKALAAALGDDLDASLDSTAPAYWGPSEPGAGDPALPEGVEPLADFVTGPANLARRLRQIGVAFSAEAASQLQPMLAPGQRLVTREGGLWRWDGFRAAADSATAGAKRLEQRTRLAAVVEESKTARAAVERALGVFGAATQARAEAEHLNTEARIALQDVRHELDARRRALAEAERRQGQIASRISAFAGALARIETDTETYRAELRAAGDALSGLPATGDLEAERDAVQEALAEERGRAAEARLAAERAVDEETARLRRLGDIEGERERWTARLKAAEEHVAELKQRIETLDVEIAGVPDDPAMFEQRRRMLRDEIAAAEANVAAATGALAAAEADHENAQESARAALDALAEVREMRGRDEERVIAAEARKSELAAQIAEHFDWQIGDLREIAGLQPDAPLPEASAAEARLFKLKGERERLGGVNLRAEEETREIEARLGEMRSEQEDLEEAIKRLRQGIQNLNREGRQRLLQPRSRS